MNDQAIAKLERVELRQVWKHEAYRDAPAGFAGALAANRGHPAYGRSINEVSHGRSRLKLCPAKPNTRRPARGNGCFWGKADMSWQTKLAGSVENDPQRKS